MIFTYEEKLLLILYYSGSVLDTVDTLRIALRDMYCPHEHAVAESILQKIEDAGESSNFNFSECEAAYG